MLTLNPQALSIAEDMDRARAAGCHCAPLQCVPLVLKDNFDTADLPTTGGSVTLQSVDSPRRRVCREAAESRRRR